MPSLMKVFSSGDEVVRFEPRGPEDEAAAVQATDYVNWIWNHDNDGFSVFHDWFKDALLKMMGAVKRFWDRVNGRYASTGSANAYVMTPDVALGAYVLGERYSFRASFANTGPATLNISSLGATSIKKMTALGKADLAPGDIQAGQPVTVEYDGTHLVLVTASPSRLELIQVQTASSSATLDFESGFDGTYRELLFVLTSIRPAADAQNLWVRVKSGGSYLTSAYHYHIQALSSAANGYNAASNTNDAKIIVSSATGNAAAEGLSGRVEVLDPANASMGKVVQGQIGGRDGNTVAYMNLFSGSNDGTGALQGVRFMFGSGNIAAGTIAQYGLR
jgi:hypothetical protein